jgi:hypothetical protein
MTPRQFAALATVAALSLIAAILVYSSRAPWSGDAGGNAALAPNLASDVHSVERINITQGGKTLSIEKSGDQWLVKSQDGYPASAEKIRTLLIALTDAKLLEPKTKVASRYPVLNVDDPAGKLSNARLIKIEDASGNTLAEVIAGKEKPNSPGAPQAAGQASGGTYVRRPSEEQSWLASTSIVGGTALKDWTAPRVFETETEKIKDLTVEIQGEAPYTIKRTAEGNHELAAVPAGKKIKYVNMVDNIIEAASFVDFERVRKTTGTTGGEVGTVKFDTDNGLKIALKVRRDKDGAWVTIDATGEGEAKTTADDIKTRTAGWEFEILPSKADTMLKKQGDLLEDIAAVDAGPGASAAPMPPLPTP